MDWRNQLYFGDNLTILRQCVTDESVDLIYLDPPFNSGSKPVAARGACPERSRAERRPSLDEGPAAMNRSYSRGPQAGHRGTGILGRGLPCLSEVDR